MLQRLSQMRVSALAWRLAFLYAALFFVLGCYLPYMPVWLKWRGLGDDQIALLLATPLFLRVLFTPAIAFAADWSCAHRGVLIALGWGSLLSFQKVSGDRALDEVAGHLRELRGRGRPEPLVLVRGGARRVGSRLAQRYLAAFGSPNDVTLERGEVAASLAMQLSQGVLAPPAYEIASSDYVLSLGGALLESWSSPVHATRAYGHFRQGRTGPGGS